MEKCIVLSNQVKSYFSQKTLSNQIVTLDVTEPTCVSSNSSGVTPSPKLATTPGWEEEEERKLEISRL